MGDLGAQKPQIHLVALIAAAARLKLKTCKADHDIAWAQLKLWGMCQRGWMVIGMELVAMVLTPKRIPFSER